MSEQRNPLIRNGLLRGALGLALMLGLGIGCQFIAFGLENAVHVDKDLRPMVSSLALLPGLLAGYLILVKGIERRPLSEAAPGKALPQIAIGLAVGAGLFALTMAPLMALGFYQAHGLNPAGVLIKPLVLALVAAVMEELLFRGLIQRLIEERFGPLWALGVTSLLFGLAHGINPGATPFTFLIIAAEAGLLLGACWVATRSLWLPIAVHFAWNFTQGGVFGAAVSGNSSDGLVAGQLRGPVLLTGGAFGPEASVQAVAFAVTAALIILWIAGRKGMLAGPVSPALT